MNEYISAKSCFLIYRESKAEWQCSMSMTKYGMSMTKYGKYESDGLWSRKWMRWTMVDKMNGIDFGLWTQQRWSGGVR